MSAAWGTAGEYLLKWSIRMLAVADDFELAASLIASRCRPFQSPLARRRRHSSQSCLLRLLNSEEPRGRLPGRRNNWGEDNE